MQFSAKSTMSGALGFLPNKEQSCRGQNNQVGLVVKLSGANCDVAKRQGFDNPCRRLRRLQACRPRPLRSLALEQHTVLFSPHGFESWTVRLCWRRDRDSTILVAACGGFRLVDLAHCVRSPLNSTLCCSALTGSNPGRSDFAGGETGIRTLGT